MNQSRRLGHNYEVSRKLNVPFSWEFSPGIPKITSQGSTSEEEWDRGARFTPSFSLPPPPCPSEHMSSARLDYIEEDNIDKQLNSLPLRSVLQLSPMVGRSLSILGSNARKDPEPEDPFLAAFVNCTRSPFSFSNKFPKNNKGKRFRRCAMIKKTIFTLSCLYSCNVVNENAMGTSPLSPKKSCCL
ncbi:hypothetical protein TIFTF001_005603 [Ficus carica]|uniref:Uncharacterized protein n=1 Tax=Ficus carica TaxID=3494 RepID=A0AA87ZMB9_FICCA|nr:hypothetical protein TIFTF001_005603 [Ficus carica]